MMDRPDKGSTSLPLMPPAPGDAIEVADGILWARIPLPTRLNHVNIYLVEDGTGWCVVDTGIFDPICIDSWDRLLANVLRERPITRLICTHSHKDHVGMAGWLNQRHDFKFLMSQSEYFLARLHAKDKSAETFSAELAFYQRHGLAKADATAAVEARWRGRSQVQVPEGYDRLHPGQLVKIGSRDWRVMTAGGHSVEQVLLYSEADRVLLAADQILSGISPNIGVSAMAPAANPLQDFFDSLTILSSEIAQDALILPGHKSPFIGTRQRAAQLKQHHIERCGRILACCRNSFQSSADLISTVFDKKLGPDVLASAITEVVAHLNFLIAKHQLTMKLSGGIQTYRSM